MESGKISLPRRRGECAADSSEAGAACRQTEGGRSHVAQIEALTAAGIPVIAHIGMMPQSVKIEGGLPTKRARRPSRRRRCCWMHSP